MATSAPRPGRCWYCGEPHLLSTDAPEHVIPAAIGAGLTTDRVGGSCNERAGREVDAVFLDDWFVREARQRHGIADRRHSRKPPRGPRQSAALEDGTPVRIDTADRWRPVVQSRVERDETEIRIRAADETELERLIKKEVLRIRSEGKTATPGVVRPMPIERPRVNVKFQVDRYIWLRMAAKVALATTSLVLGESWLDSQQARELQGWLWDSRPTNRSGEHLQGAPVRPEGTAMPLLCRPPEHLVLFHPLGPERAGLMAAVFGEVLLPIPAIELGGQPQPQRAWRLDPTTGRTVATTREALLAEAAVALVQAMNAAQGDSAEIPPDAESSFD